EVTGAYHFFQSGVNAADQMDAFLPAQDKIKEEFLGIDFETSGPNASFTLRDAEHLKTMFDKYC
ncbi:hypothetical protein, partial [Paenibacillus larvae]|uniref:hypothetical protein n=1 Tax=Paenibacillus larvae TaxID=1464 RepID=UPI0039FBD5BA